MTHTLEPGSYLLVPIRRRKRGVRLYLLPEAQYREEGPWDFPSKDELFGAPGSRTAFGIDAYPADKLIGSPTWSFEDPYERWTLPFTSGGKDGVRSYRGAISVPRSVWRAFRQMMMRYATRGVGLVVAVDDSSPYAQSISFASDSGDGYERLFVRDAFQRAIVAVAMREAERSLDQLPPLSDPSKWRRSPIHRACRRLGCELAEQAVQQGWSPERLSDRVRTALSLLLEVRAGGLGLVSDDEDDKRSELVLDQARFEAAVDPGPYDSKTAILYALLVPQHLTGKLAVDDAAKDRLRRTVDAIPRYLELRWLRSPVIAAPLAQAAVLHEYAQFGEAYLRTPASLFDADDIGESKAFVGSDGGRRPNKMAAILLGHDLLRRGLWTIPVAALLWFLETPLPLLWGGLWFLFAPNLWRFLAGPPAPTAKSRMADLLPVFSKVSRNAFGKNYVSVDGLKDLALMAHREGVVWPEGLWILLADAERRGERVWVFDDTW